MNDTLHYVTFFITKRMTLRKHQDSMCYVFINKNLDSFFTRFFIEFLTLAKPGCIFIYKKWTLCYIVISKNNILCVKFQYTKRLIL